MSRCRLRGIGSCLSIIILFLASGVYASGHPYVLAQNTGGQAYYRETEIAKFSSREDAEKLAKKIRGGGFETVIRTDISGDKTVYRVFVLVHDSGPKTSVPDSTDKDEIKTPAPAPREDRPVGISRSSEDLFGRRAGYFHSSVTLTESYTDNAFYTKDNKKSDWSTVLSPVLWLALPRVNEQYLELPDVSPRFGGGLVLDRYKKDVSGRYQAYLGYGADIPIGSSKNSPSGNTVTHNAYGSISYYGNNISVDAMDQFTRSYETRGVSIATQQGEVDRYYSNLFNTMVHLDTGNRLRFSVGYSNFLVDYDASRNDFRNRMDNGVAGYVVYKLRPKTSIFAEYDFLNIDYRNDDTYDSQEHHFYGGVQWDITAKSRGVVKAGYAIKDFTNIGESYNDFVAEARINHYFSPRSNVTLTALRKTTESAIQSTLFAVTSEVGVNYQQILTPRITGSASLFYINDKYTTIADGETTAADVNDDTYEAGLGLQYEFKKWIKTSIEYTYAKRNSNFSVYDYTSNTFFFRITGSL